MWRVLSAGVLGLVLMMGPVAAQQSFGTLLSPILTVDSERLFLDSAFGKRVAREIEEDGAELAAEHRLIEAELAEEEERLTSLRPSMNPEEFRAIADAFDEKVQNIRAERVAKNRVLNQRLNQERGVFLNAARPVLEALMREAEAAVILERRSVFLSANAIDITARAIEQLDATLGSGAPSDP